MDRRDTPNEKLDGNERKISIENHPVLKWLDNFWYHYKWPTVIIAFFAVVIVFCVTQQVTKQKEDLVFAYCGPYTFATDEVQPFQKALSSAIPEDFDNDGTKSAGLVRYEIHSEEEIEAFSKRYEGLTEESAEQKKKEEDNGSAYVINLPYNASQYSNFNQFLVTGECSVFFCSPYIYDVIRGRGLVCKLSDALGTECPLSEDGTSVLLKDTAFYKKYPAAQVLPDDTVVILLQKPAWGDQSKDDIYRRSVETIRYIIGK